MGFVGASDPAEFADWAGIDVVLEVSLLGHVFCFTFCWFVAMNRMRSDIELDYRAGSYRSILPQDVCAKLRCSIEREKKKK